jgi:hypothetical protein
VSVESSVCQFSETSGWFKAIVENLNRICRRCQRVILVQTVHMALRIAGSGCPT